jgi:hypothetical protein
MTIDLKSVNASMRAPKITGKAKMDLIGINKFLHSKSDKPEQVHDAKSYVAALRGKLVALRSRILSADALLTKAYKAAKTSEDRRGIVHLQGRLRTKLAPRVDELTRDINALGES